MTKLISLREHLSAKTGLPVSDVDNLIFAFLQVLTDNLRRKVDVIDLYPLMQFSRFKKFPTKISDLGDYLAAMHEYNKCIGEDKKPSEEILDKIMGSTYLTQYYIPSIQSELDKLEVKLNKRQGKEKTKTSPIKVGQARTITYV